MDVRRLAARTDLDFTPRGPVRWLAPAQLARTAVKAALSGAFAAYWDKRESQSALGAELVEIAADPDGGLWLDYTADTGDGFDATATVAWLLAAERLTLAAHSGDSVEFPETTLPRGRVLVLGGDEVYPTPTVGDYDDRLKGPLRSMLPEHPAPVPAPRLLAVPGNHDWYDGLTAFVRTFTQRRRIGGWQTTQQRSYFAARLPQGWWLVGLDTQLGTELDDPQVRFFTERLAPQLRQGDAVIVCAPTPTWVRVGEGCAAAFDQLRWFERQVVRPAGAQVRLWLSGDDHHYAHYVEDVRGNRAPRHAVTCGLGGAYLAPTHDIPERLEVPGPRSRVREPVAAYTLASRWPDAATSRRLGWGAVASRRAVPLRNRGFWGLMGAVQALAFLVVASVLAFGVGGGPAAAIRDASAGQVRHVAVQVGSWFAWVFVAAIAVTLIRRARFGWVGPAVGVAAQVGLTVAMVAGACAVGWPEGTPAWLVSLVCLAVAWLVGGFVSALLVGAAFLLVGAASARSRLSRSARGVVMSSQAIEDWKGILRLRLRPDGTLVVHPIGVRRVCRDWDVVAAEDTDHSANGANGVNGANGAQTGRRIVPAAGHEPRPERIEPPFEVRRR